MSHLPAFEVRRFEEIGSTNTYLMEQARAGAPAGLVATADFQTAGRGRQGRRWEAPPGSALMASVLLRPTMAADDAHVAATAVALAGRSALDALANLTPSLKWPNDLVVDGAKLAGILGEVAPSAPGGRPGSVAVVVGIGINLSTSGPPEAKGTSVQIQTGSAPSAGALLEALLEQLAPRVLNLDGLEGRAELMAEAQAAMSTLGSRVRVERHADVLEGLAVGLSPEAHLLVTDDAGVTHEVAVGDVIHLRPAG